MNKKFICALLAILSCISLASCLETDYTPPTTDLDTTETSQNTPGADPDEAETNWDKLPNGDVFLGSDEENAMYLSTYGDSDAAKTWGEKNSASSKCPPVSFIINEKSSDELNWTRKCSEVTTVTDYPDSNPKQRAFYTITYTCEEYDIAVEVVVTLYPDFPVVEYEATLINTSDGTSEEIKDLCSIDRDI